jgi:hypothetical protein
LFIVVVVSLSCEYIAQFKFTFFILPKETIKLSAAFPLPHVTSQYDIATVPEIQQVCIAMIV